MVPTDPKHAHEELPEGSEPPLDGSQVRPGIPRVPSVSFENYVSRVIRHLELPNMFHYWSLFPCAYFLEYVSFESAIFFKKNYLLKNNLLCTI